jgi:hypothetical protein
MRQPVDRPQGPFTRPAGLGQRQSYEGDETIDGLPTYHKSKAPDHLVTQRQLDKRGMKRAKGQGPAAWLWVCRPGRGRMSGRPYLHWEPVALYDLAKAVAKRPMTPRQREVLVAAREQAGVCRDLGPDAYKTADFER